MSDGRVPIDVQTHELMPVDRHPPPAPPARKDRGFQVFEGLSRFFEKWLYAEETSLLVAKRSMKIARAGMQLPARLLMLYVWKKSLLTKSAETSIAIYGAVLSAIITIDLWAWWSTLSFVMNDFGTKSVIALSLASLNALVDRTIIIADMTARGLIPQYQLQRKIVDGSVKRAWLNAALDFTLSALGRAFSGPGLNFAIRIAIIAVMAKTNGEAIRLQLSEPETAAIAQQEDERIARDLRGNRVTEIETEITRRGTEAAAETQTSVRAWTEERRAAREHLMQERQTTTAAKRTEVERLERAMQGEMHGSLSGHAGVGPRVAELRALHQDAQDDLRAYEQQTPEALREHDEATNRGRLNREEELTRRRAQLNAEKDRRLNEARTAPLATLGTAAGINTTRPRGIWSRLDALEIVHRRSPASRYGDWFAQFVLFAIGCLPLLIKRLGNADVKMYYSLRAQAEGGTDEKMRNRALAVYHETVRQDPSVATFYRRWFEVCAHANIVRITFFLKVTEIAKQRDTDHLSLTKPEIDALTLAAWNEKNGMQEALADLGNLELVAALANLELSWPSTLGEDPRALTPIISSGTLITSHGWDDMSRVRREIKRLREDHDRVQEELGNALETFRAAFPRGITPQNIEAAHSFYADTILPIVQSLRKIERGLRGRRIMTPTWIEGRDLFQASNAIAAQLGLDGRTTPPVTEAASSANASSSTPDDIASPKDDETAQVIEEAARLSRAAARTDTQPGPNRPYLHIVPPSTTE